MAVKFIRIPVSQFEDEDVQRVVEKIRREVDNFRILWENPNIVDFYGFCVVENSALLFMELMDLSLRKLYLVVHKKKEKFPEKLVGWVFVRILEALLFCQEKGIIHRDIKPSNILVNYR